MGRLVQNHNSVPGRRRQGNLNFNTHSDECLRKTLSPKKSSNTLSLSRAIKSKRAPCGKSGLKKKKKSVFCPVFVLGSRCGGGGRRKTLWLCLKAAADAGSPEAVRPRGLRGPGPIKRPARHCQIPSCQAAIRQTGLGGAPLLPLDQQFTVPCCNRSVFSQRVLVTDRPQVKSGGRCERCIKPCYSTNVQYASTLLCLIYQRKSGEDAKKTQKDKAEGKKKKAVMNTKQLGLQAQQQHPGQD